MRKKIFFKFITTALAVSMLLGIVAVPSSGARADGDSVTLKLNKQEMSVICGQDDSLKATLKGSTSKVIWKSSNTKVASVDSNGKVKAKQAGTVTITASAAGETAKCTVQVLYKDVTDDSEFWYAPTNYLTAKDVVRGYDGQTKFKPANKCTRAQMVTFIWRLEGEPAPKTETCKFSDVKESDYFYKACIWGNENGIVEGYKDGTFGPQIVCARKHAVTFLWRLAGKPTPKSTKNKFKDVKKSDYYYKATLWASEMSILAGYKDGTFRPDGDCLRRQMVTFLYKYDNAVGSKTTPAKKQVINVMSFNNEVISFVESYMESHPDIAKKFEINKKVVANDDGNYLVALDAALAAGGDGAPDIYSAEAEYVLKYTQGSMAKYAAAYKDLGINVSSEIKKADIADYNVDMGTRPSDGKLVGLAFQSKGGGFIYRRSIAKEVFGTDDPSVIAKKVGPGWDKFMDAAAALKEKGYVICSGLEDVWRVVEGGSSKSWVNSKGQLVIDPDREKFLDLAKELYDNDYTNRTFSWAGEWFDDMAGAGPRQCFGFFGPAWLINYTMSDNCGSWVDTGKKDDSGNPIRRLDRSMGTYGDWAVCTPPVGFFWGGTWVMANKSVNDEKREVVADIIRYITLDCTKDGLQYSWANGLLNSAGTKDTVASGVVMDMSDGKCDFLGGQNMFKIFVPASKYATGKNKSQYDDVINAYWNDVAHLYAEGVMTRSQAISEFKTKVKEDLGF